MAECKIEHAEIKAIATCVPTKVDYINDYTLLSQNERNNFMKTVGVKQRRSVEKGTTTSDLCAFAAEKLFQETKWEKDSIDGLIMVTQSPDYLIPASSIILQERLGLPNDCMAFDINLGCSGYVIGLQTAASLLGEHGLKRILLLIGDIPTANLSYHDKATYPLFGDAGSATLIEYNPKAETMYFQAESEGKDYDALYIPDGGMKNMATPESFEYSEFEGGIKRNRTHMILDGIRIFNFSISKVPLQIKSILEKSNYKIEDIDYFFLHQANKIMNETIRRKLKISPEKFPYSIDNYGNTSSASIPLSICLELSRKNDLPKNNCILSGFGIGLSWATAKISLKDSLILPIIEYEIS